MGKPDRAEFEKLPIKSIKIPLGGFFPATHSLIAVELIDSRNFSPSRDQAVYICYSARHANALSSRLAKFTGQPFDIVIDFACIAKRRLKESI